MKIIEEVDQMNIELDVDSLEIYLIKINQD